MSSSASSMSEFSNQMADAIAAAAPSVVQVVGRGRPVSGLVYADSVVVTTARALGRDDDLRVRRDDGDVLPARSAGWDPATGLAALHVPDLKSRPITLAADVPRVGHLALAAGRSWSNALTASAGIVAIIGGPLATGRRRSIDQVIRTTAPMHEGFAGGAFLDTRGGLLGVATAAAIRGLGVVIPAGIAWKAVAAILEQGHAKRGYLGLAGQSVRLSGLQRTGSARERALLVVGISEGGPAEAAGLMVGDAILEFDGHSVETPEDLLDLLSGERVGRERRLRVQRGDAVLDVDVTVRERES
jgi:S1-C subfamily serine protease